MRLFKLLGMAAAIALGISSVPGSANALLYSLNTSSGWEATFDTEVSTTVTGKIVNLIANLSPLCKPSECLDISDIPPAAIKLYIEKATHDFLDTGTPPTFTNPNAIPGLCAPGLCSLVFMPTPDDPLAPSTYAILDENGSTFDSGTYQLEPIPVPATLPLLLAGVGLFGLAAIRKRQT